MSSNEYMRKYYHEVLKPKRQKERAAGIASRKQKREYTFVGLCEQFPDVDIAKYKNPMASLKYLVNRNNIGWRKETLLRSIKHRAQKNNLEYNLEKDKMYWPEICPIFGTKLDYNARMSNRENAPSVDRINPKGGYTLDNTVIISHRANKIKSDATLDEIQKIYEYILKVNV